MQILLKLDLVDFFMKRTVDSGIVEYDFELDKFKSLKKSLAKKGYRTHPFSDDTIDTIDDGKSSLLQKCKDFFSAGSGNGTIDDGKSDYFDECKMFSEYIEYKDDSDDARVNLKAKDAGLIAAIDSYFEKK